MSASSPNRSVWSGSLDQAAALALTNARELAGSLRTVEPPKLWAWIGHYRLTCEVSLDRPGGHAVICFRDGHVESAQVNGRPELAVLARVSSWTDATYRIRLRPSPPRPPAPPPAPAAPTARRPSTPPPPPAV